MRDIVILAIVAAASIAALRRPWIGIMLWTWLSIMNPHRFSFGIAYSAPLAAIAAGVTLIGFATTREKSSPMKGAPVTWLVVFMVWITLSWLMGLDVSDDYWQWNKVMKVFFMIIVGMALLRTKEHILALACVAAGSLAVLGVKGGIFTIMHGGNYRVWGPPGSFIEDNNEFALSLVMTIPLLRFLQTQVSAGWRRHAMTAVMVLCAASALGSQSRGALLAIAAMTVMMWWRGRNRLVGGVLIAIASVSLVSFMPDSWDQRMSTIQTYDKDDSALGRISAWWTAWGIAKDHLFGVGFNAARPELFAQYSPYPDSVHAAHSIYFQTLGNHGFVGLVMFLGVMLSSYWYAGRLRKESAVHADAAWCEQLGAMCQVSLVGYLVGGAFLSLAYFDLPYNVLMLAVLGRAWVRARAWEREPAQAPRWLTRLAGIVPKPKVA